MNKPSPRERATQFVGALRQLQARQDRGSLAALRAGLSTSTVMKAWPLVARMGGEIGQPGNSVHVDIAALYATHPSESQHRNFGQTCRVLSWDQQKGALRESGETRFRRLLSSDSAEDLGGQLRTWIRMASSQGVGVNYESLFADLWNWPWYSDDIRVQWAKAYWLSPAEQASLEQTEQAKKETT